MEDYDNALEGISVLLNDELSNEIKNDCVARILGYTNNERAISKILEMEKLINFIVCLVEDNNDSSRLCFMALINLTTKEEYVKKILNIDKTPMLVDGNGIKIIKNSFEHICNSNSDSAGTCSMLLCNLSRSPTLASYVTDCIEKLPMSLEKLTDAFTKVDFNKKGCKLDYLGMFFSNLSQCEKGVEQLCPLMDKLVCFTDYEDSNIRRRGIIGMLRNVSFRPEKRDWMLSEDGLNVLPYLLLPLAGPEQFDEDDMDKLPIQLQYLPETKKRDSDAECRRLLLEILLQFCSNSKGRTFLRDNNAYIILRELHKVEEDREVLLACENVVDILIRTEEEIGVDELSSLEVPEDLQKKFSQMDSDFLKDN